MKQSKKRWAWTARQRGRVKFYTKDIYYVHGPGKWLLRHLWSRHRMQTVEALHQIKEGLEEAQAYFLFHHKHNGHWLSD
jgi:hypothetical protein